MNRQTKSVSLIALATVLGVAVVAQTIYLVQLNKKVEQLETAAAAPVSLPDSLTPSAGAAAAIPSQPLGNHDPLAGIRQLQQQMDAMFGSALGSGWGPLSNLSAGIPGRMTGAPNIEVTETSNDYQIIVDVPENGELELSTDVEDASVRVTSNVTFESDRNGNVIGSSFTGRSQFSRSIPLPTPVDPLAMQTARIDDTIVITIPKA